jgi:hypothetical protein
VINTISFEQEIDAVEVPLPTASEDERGYLVNGVHYCLVRFSRGRGADANTIAISAFAFAVDVDGKPLLRSSLNALEGRGTASEAKPSTVEQAADLARKLKSQALVLALRDLLREISVEAFNATAEI